MISAARGKFLGELVALGLVAACTWLVGSIATSAWIERVGDLGLPTPDLGAVRRNARRAMLLFSIGVAAIGAARFWSYRQSRDPIAAFWILPCALAAALLGLVVQLATVEVSRGAVIPPTGVPFAQGVLLGCIAGAVILVLPRDPGELVARAQLPLGISIIVLFGALAVAGSGPAGTGTKINLGPLQPLEIIKPLVVLLLAGFLGARASKLRWQRRRILGLRWPRLELLVPAIGILLAIFAALYVIGDLGPVLLLAAVFLGMFYLASRATGWAVIALALVVLVFVLLAWKPELAGSGTVLTRLRMWQDPWTNALSNGHQLGEGAWAIAAGHWSGQGLAYAATPIVPAGKTDLVLATMTEQLGASWLVGYQLLLAAIVFGALHVAARARTAERTLIAGGVGLLLLVQWIVIHGGTFGQLPLTGIVVPFLSSGKSSMIAFVAVVALVVRIADSQPRERTTELAELHGAVRAFAIVAACALAFAVITGLSAAVVDRHAISARSIVVKLGDGTLVERQNPRLVAIAEQLRRGTISDRNGEPLATSSIAGAAGAGAGRASAAVGAGTAGAAGAARAGAAGAATSGGGAGSAASVGGAGAPDARAAAADRGATGARGATAPRPSTGSATARSARRHYPLGTAIGGLVGVFPSTVLLPSWSAERTFDHRLRGYAERPGAKLASPDLSPFTSLLDLDREARAAKIAELDAAIDKRSVRLTIDSKLQRQVAAALAAGKHLAAAAVVIDVDTGEILARAQVPDWDPNDATWQTRIVDRDRSADERAWLARFHGTYGAWPDKTGIQGMFQSGSVGKLFTALAAVRAGIADRQYRCTESDAQGPFFTRPGWPKPIHDHTNDRTHGVVDLVGGIAVSCNVFFGQLGLDLGADPFVSLRADGVEAGFGSKLVPGPAGSRQLASTAFGQGAMVMSPVQAARLVAAIAGGGVYRRCAPSMELGAACTAEYLVDDPRAVAPIVIGMRRVMTAGTGAGLKSPPGVRVYGKTGTADVRGFVGEEPFGILPGAPARPHSWFVAFGEPATAAENAVDTAGRLAVAVVVPRGGTGASAAGPIAMKIFAAAKEIGYLGGAPAPTKQ